MIVRFENLINSKSSTFHYSKKQIELLKNRTLWSINDRIYLVVKVIDFTSHYNVLISPLYAWEKIAESSDWSLFETAIKDELYAGKFTDKLCLKDDKTEPGMAGISGQAVYLNTYKFDMMPKLEFGDVFVFDNTAYVVKSFEIHKRIYGEELMDRVLIVTQEVDKFNEDYTAVVSDKRVNPLNYTTGRN